MKKSILFLISFYILLIVLTTVYAVAAKNHYKNNSDVGVPYETKDSIINTRINHLILLNRASGNPVQVNIEFDSVSSHATLLNYSGRNYIQISGDTLYYSLEVGGGSLYLRNKLESISAVDVDVTIENDVLDQTSCSIELFNTSDIYNYNSNEIEYSQSASFKELNISLRNSQLTIQSYSPNLCNIENLHLNLSGSQFHMPYNDYDKHKITVGSMILCADSSSQINVPTQCLMNMRVQ
jgi:hypothetical protein